MQRWSGLVAEQPILHEFDAPPGVGAQLLGNRVRVVVWFRCARCGHFMAQLAEFVPPVIQQPGWTMEGAIGSAASQLVAKMTVLPCSGVPAPKVT